MERRLPHVRTDHGQTMAEYGVTLAAITLAIVGALALLSGAVVRAVARVTTVLGF